MFAILTQTAEASTTLTAGQMILTIAGIAIGSSGFWEFIKYLINTFKKKKSTVEDEALLALLHDRLYYLCNKYIGQTSIKADDYNNLLHLYQAYRALGGNGLIERMFTQITQLPIN